MAKKKTSKKRVVKKTAKKTAKKRVSSKKGQCCMLWGPCEKKAPKTTATRPGKKLFARREQALKELIEDGYSLKEAAELLDEDVRDGLSDTEIIAMHKKQQPKDPRHRQTWRATSDQKVVQGWVVVAPHNEGWATEIDQGFPSKKAAKDHVEALLAGRSLGGKYGNVMSSNFGKTPLGLARIHVALFPKGHEAWKRGETPLRTDSFFADREEGFYTDKQVEVFYTPKKSWWQKLTQ